MDRPFSPRSAHSDDDLVQTLCDPTFKPQPGLNFAESHSEEAPGLQPTIGSPHALNQNQQGFFNPAKGISFDPDFQASENTNQFSQNTGIFEQILGPIKSTHGWQNQGSGDGGIFGASFPDANSMQQIVQQCRSAKQQFGQISPPDDSMSGFAPQKPTAAETAVTEAADRASTDKSDHARNAANQRHAKTKNMRKGSEGSNPVDGDDGEGKVGDKKEKYREKNRLAAAKCRAKKKENIEDIEVKDRKLSAMNSSLKKQVQDLRGELTGLRAQALYHQDCDCQISWYNINQAKRVALGAEASLLSGDSQGYGGSFSYMRSPPGTGGMPSRSNFPSPSNFAFASVTTADDLGMQSQEGSHHFGEYFSSGYGDSSFSQGLMAVMIRSPEDQA